MNVITLWGRLCKFSAYPLYKYKSLISLVSEFLLQKLSLEFDFSNVMKEGLYLPSFLVFCLGHFFKLEEFQDHSDPLSVLLVFFAVIVYISAQLILSQPQ